MGNENSYSVNSNGHVTQMNQPSIPQFPSQSLSLSKSKSKTKTKTKTKSKSSWLKSKSKSKFSLSPPSLALSFNPSSTSSINLPELSNLGYQSNETSPVESQMINLNDLSKIDNGITGQLISNRVVKIAAEFWETNISNKPLSEKLEIGCTIYFGMMVHDKDLKKVLKKAMKRNSSSIEGSSVKFLDMMGWLIRGLTRDDMDLFSLLNRLGNLHKNMGVNINHYDPMLNAMHEAFAYYFDIKYRIEIKYAIDQIFTVAARIMTGQDFKESKYAHLQDLDESIKNGAFLESLPVCLASNVGQEYLYRFLQQTFCDEIAIFLQSLNKFKAAMSDKERFMTARCIIKNSIEPQATFTVNISYECRQNSINKMTELERMFFEKDNLLVSKDLFKSVEQEICKLIQDNHWRKFTETFKKFNETNE